jgi:hypothetical protein
MWGSKANQAAIHKHVARYVRLLRYEKYSVKQLMVGIRVNDFSWLYSGPATCAPQEHRTRTQMAQLWLLWLFNFVVEPCVKAHFYVTDTALYRNRLFYFRKPIWRQLERLELARIANTNQFVALSSLPPAEQEHIKARALGTTVLRFLPKANSMRYLCNLSRRPTDALGYRVRASHLSFVYEYFFLGSSPCITFDCNQGQSINQQLQNLFSVLKFERVWTIYFHPRGIILVY